ncbi:MAG TPA: hypothetical protein P5157_01965 [Paludibacteraceae bacterium]|jgi:putative effector of murein hydrolase LrgA (UPF0299 family)|nr:hypothetical protein [Paludibacteraceae bacterium]OPZ02833.1 MAG: hypothetical protein BWZ11_00569 [Bacteroidetes bacterium ADurb.BinA395]MBP8966178.1 hypothetical protein [Paludibacteraceae bacterium]HOF98248.1 hypothetical protein [Paludibacteraceae bacterium]HOJ65767.1 hypothetical protein [Paludibacteraceae bacterium]
METKKKLRCPLGIPGGIIAALIGLIGIIVNIVAFNWFQLIISLALLLLALPFVRVTMMVHMANDRLDELEEKINSKK